jgi:hypothetical protein
LQRSLSQCQSHLLPLPPPLPPRMRADLPGLFMGFDLTPPAPDLPAAVPLPLLSFPPLPPPLPLPPPPPLPLPLPRPPASRAGCRYPSMSAAELASFCLRPRFFPPKPAAATGEEYSQSRRMWREWPGVVSVNLSEGSRALDCRRLVPMFKEQAGVQFSRRVSGDGGGQSCRQATLRGTGAGNWVQAIEK